MSLSMHHGRAQHAPSRITKVANGRLFEDIQTKLAELFAASPARDLEGNVKTLIGNAFTRLDLATREELDVQAKLLARTRERVEQLEARLTELEAKK